MIIVRPVSISTTTKRLSLRHGKDVIMKKRILSVVLLICLVMSTAACSMPHIGNSEEDIEESEDKEESVKKKKDKDGEEGHSFETDTRQFLLKDNEPLYDTGLKPSIAPYTIKSDLSNVVYNSNYRSTFDTSYEYFYEGNRGIVEGLAKNGFAVSNGGFDEFFDIYESNRYNMFPNFVTVDSLMHTYHLYFAYLMKNTEKNYLSASLAKLSDSMLDKALEQFDDLYGTEWEDAAFTNVIFFTVGAMLQDDSYSIDLGARQDEFDNAVKDELDKIYKASGITNCIITNDLEDYSQYKPRGYYEGDELLEKYFRTMMWYGRISFYTESEEMNKSSVLIVKALEEAGDDEWEGIYNVTSFFAGASDDPGYYEFRGIVDECFGENADVSDIAEDKEGFIRYCKKLEDLELPAINSVPVWDGEDPVKPSYRFMGQRFTIDASVMQKLVYSSVKENPSGGQRMLPDTLDVAGVLGSRSAEELLKESGAFEYEGYEKNYNEMKEFFDSDDPEIWNASLYAAWLNTLRPLLADKPEGYPSYKLSDEWAKKSLETFAGSYAELKHDTILYAEQVISEMGGGEDEEVYDDRGYVDPEPVVYSNFANLASNTRDGLDSYGMLSEDAKEDLDILTEIAKKLLVISEKELKCEALTDEEYDFIREYGGNLEHFWKKANEDDYEGTLGSSYQAPCPVIADIATDPNGSVLEVGSGEASVIYVIFPIDGELHIGSGSAYSFYQFVNPLSDRLTDSQWQEMLEPEYDFDNNRFNWDSVPKQPEWTLGYRTER